MSKKLQPGTQAVEYGVVLDDLGSIDVYPTYREAAEAFSAHGGLELVEIVTRVAAYHLPTPESA